MKSIFLVMTVVAVMAAPGMANAQAGADLAKSKGCLGCHEMDKKKVGPAFKDVAAKYKGNKDAETMLIGKLKEGKGHMKIAASDAELKTLVEWVRSAK